MKQAIDLLTGEACMNGTRGLAAALAALVLFPACAVAQRVYMGASGGTTRIDSGYADQVESGLAAYEGGAITASDASANARGRAGRVFAGVRLSDVFAIEADYTKLGDINARYIGRDTPPAPQTTSGEFRWDFKAQAFALALVANARLGKDIAVFGRAGAARTRLNRSFSGCTSHIYYGITQCGELRWSDVTQTRPVAGIGLDWGLTERVALRASWDRYFGVGEAFNGDPHPASGKVGKFDVDYVGIGVRYAF